GGEHGARVEAAGVEEVGAPAAGLEGEIAEAQGLRPQRQFQEAATVSGSMRIGHAVILPRIAMIGKTAGTGGPCASPASTPTACARRPARDSSTGSPRRTPTSSASRKPRP